MRFSPPLLDDTFPNPPPQPPPQHPPPTPPRAAPCSKVEWARCEGWSWASFPSRFLLVFTTPVEGRRDWEVWLQCATLTRERISGITYGTRNRVRYAFWYMRGTSV